MIIDSILEEQVFFFLSLFLWIFGKLFLTPPSHANQLYCSFDMLFNFKTPFLSAIVTITLIQGNHCMQWTAK
jgi:ABC-type transport system involved in multi-copper enzyme maturation permease subunit